MVSEFRPTHNRAFTILRHHKALGPVGFSLASCKEARYDIMILFMSNQAGEKFERDYREQVTYAGSKNKAHGCWDLKKHIKFMYWRYFHRSAVRKHRSKRLNGDQLESGTMCTKWTNRNSEVIRIVINFAHYSLCRNKQNGDGRYENRWAPSGRFYGTIFTHANMATVNWTWVGRST